MKDRRELEKKAKAELEEQGYLVDKAWLEASYIGPGKPVAKRRDFFHAFDLLAVRDNEVRFIQVTSTEELAKKDPHDILGSHRRRIDEAFPVDVPLEIWFFRRNKRSWEKSIYTRSKSGNGFVWTLHSGQTQLGFRFPKPKKH